MLTKIKLNLDNFEKINIYVLGGVVLSICGVYIINRKVYIKCGLHKYDRGKPL